MPKSGHSQTCTWALLLSLLGAAIARPHLRLDNNPWPQSGMQPWLSDLPPLSDDHAPTSENWTNSIALCAVMKNENVTDIIEWLTYYHWLGIEHVFLTDNGSVDQSDLLSRLSKLFPPSFLTLRTEERAHGQMKVYAWCVEEHRASYNWLAFLDIDEFLVIRDSSVNGLKGLLDEYKAYAGLSVQWVIVGPSGRESRPEQGGVLEAYDQCVPRPHVVFKTIANTYFVEGLSIHPHNFFYRDGKRAVGEDFTQIGTQWHNTPAFAERGGTNEMCAASPQPDPKDCFVIPALQRGRAPGVERAVIFHFITRSLEDYKRKLARGGGKIGITRKMDLFYKYQRLQRRAPICNVPQRLASRCCSHALDIMAHEAGSHFSDIAARQQVFYATLGGRGRPHESASEPSE